jgi:hypothetical protein
MATPSERFSVRLSPEHLKLLKKEAAEQGTSPASLASRLIVRDLTDAESDEVRTEVEDLRRELLKLRGDIATLLYGTLVIIGKQDPVKTKAFIEENFTP